MEFGGSTLNRYYNRENSKDKRGNTRRTSDVFELATAVLFQSSVQNFALAPNNLIDAPAWAIEFMKESQSSIMAHLNFSNTLNSVASKMRYNQNTGGKITDLVNVNGNWSANGFLNYNTPLRNKKFTISTFSNASFSDAVSYTSISANSAAEAQKSTTHSMNLSQRLTGNFRCDLLDFTLNGSVRYSLIKNNSNRESFDYTVGSSTNINLP